MTEQGEVVVMDAEDMRRAITRIAHEILERNRGAKDLVVIGIQRRGAPVARRLALALSQIEGVGIPCGSVDITPFRDDIERKPSALARSQTDVPFPITDKRVISGGRGHPHGAHGARGDGSRDATRTPRKHPTGGAD
jgi:pyrimidine operon attenuation protein/uracil phosphoribosyltransferase